MAHDLVLIAPYNGGHHGEYVRWLLEAGRRRGLSLALAGSPGLLADLTDDFGYVPDGVDVVSLASTSRLVDARPGWAAMRATSAVLAEAVARTDAPRALLTYLDHAVVALAAGLRFPRPVRFSGLLFRPPFADADPTAGRVRRALKQAVLRRAGAHPHVDTVFTLDPDAPPLLERLGVDGVYLPDPVDPSPPSVPADAVRAAYGVLPDRQLAVLFGSLEERKGLYALLDALLDVPAEAARRLAVVIAGKTYDSVRPRLVAGIERVQRETEVQVVFREGFLPDEALADLTASADVVLAAYLGHAGSSGVVLRAAAAGTPLIAQAAGQIGREVRRHRLGWTVDPADRAALADVLAEAVRHPQRTFDAAAAAQYAEAHHVDRFTDRLYDTLLRSR